MARTPVAPKHGKKRKISITPSADLLEWVMERTGEGKQFGSVTHAAERGWQTLREIEEGKWVRATDRSDGHSDRNSA